MSPKFVPVFASKALRKLRHNGLLAAAGAGAASLRRWAMRRYPGLRAAVPTIGYPVCNGVLVARPRRLSDPLVPRAWIPEVIYEDLPFYESALVHALQRHTREGDRVVIIGGGYGVTLVAAARAVGRRGSVLCYEPVPQRIVDLENALRLNRVEASVTLERAIVGRAVFLFGPCANAPLVAPPATL